MKGIILAGGHGTRLYPLTKGVNKQLLPVFNKPMIYYPLSALLLAGIRDILIITNSRDLPGFNNLLGDGAQWGLNFVYAEQSYPRGIADALLIGREFVGNETVCLVLGDNIFYGTTMPARLKRASQITNGAAIFAYYVQIPSRYAVVEFQNYTQETGRALSLEEKPLKPRSKFAVPGIYFYDQNAVKIAVDLKPSERGELEITDLNCVYLERGMLQVEILGRGMAWLDAGTHESLLQAANFVQTVETRQGMMISCPEEIAYRMGYISSQQVQCLANRMNGNHYSDYLLRLVNEHRF